MTYNKIKRLYNLKFNTSTITDENKISPWLAAEGPLSYSPFSPPETDYYFLYNFIVPNIFSNGVNLRQHYWFGDTSGKDGFSVRLLQDFWTNARDGKITPIFVNNAPSDLSHFEAPIAIFNIPKKRYIDSHYLFIQHGSYLKIPIKQQPLLESGFVLVHRGIGSANKFNIHPFPQDKHIIDQYRRILLDFFSDSVRSFNLAHGSTHRCETSHLRSGSIFWGLPQAEESNDQLISILRTNNQCYTLNKDFAKYKFGPSYVTFKTPVTNIRISTYFAGEDEVKIISPDKLIPIKATRCKFNTINK